MTPEAAYAELIRRTKEVAVLSSCGAVLGWDERTYMPHNGSAFRGDQMALIARLTHEMTTDPKVGEYLAAIEATSLVKNAESPEAIGKTVNVGSGREIAVGELASLIARLMDKQVTIEGDDTDRVRPGGSEVERLLADNTLARELMGWRPAISLEEGLSRTIEWIRANQDRYRPDVYTV